MVNGIKKKELLKLVLSLLIMAITANVSAQNYPARGQGAYSSRPTRSSGQLDLGEAIVKGVRNLFKKKDKERNPPKKNEHEYSTASDKAISAQNSKDDVVLVVLGEGDTKDEATKIALRSAIEQAFGTFVSSNTDILNDNLVKDEIVTVSSGNIKSFKYISENQIEGKWNVTLQAVVSIGKLISYVQQKGGETELAGATFAMDVKMKKLYKQNEETVLRHLMIQLKEIVPQMFDYSIEAASPKASSHSKYACSVKVTIQTNSNYTLARDLIWNTLGALCLNNKEDVADLEEKGMTPAIVQFFTCGNGQVPNIMTQLPVTYMKLPWNNDFNEPYVFFRSTQFFSDFSTLIREVLGNFIVDVGFEKVMCSYEDHGGGYAGYNDESNRCDFSTRNGYLNEMPHGTYGDAISIGYALCMNGSSCYFPVAKSAKWTLKGSISFTLEELERVTNIKVYSKSN